jgi:ubiquinone/menaquinone biosynthesis C-methylase UbiE
MAKNLSFKAFETTSNFYSLIHTSQKKNEDKAGLPPTVNDFKKWLELSFEKNSCNKEIKVLDAGCGANAYAGMIFLQNGFKNIYAIDINSEVESLLNSNPDCKGIKFKHSSILSIPYPDETFEVVNCSGVVHHTPTPNKAINELSRVTKRGGTIIIGVYCFENSIFEYIIRAFRVLGFFIPYKIMHFFFKMFPSINNFVLDHMYVPILWLYTPSEIKNILSENKLEVIDEWVASFDCFYGRKIFGFSLVNGGLLRTFICKKI